MMIQPLYFAYGSNMLRERIEKRLGTVEVIGPYNLQDYKLVFDVGWFDPKANIRPEVGSVVEGILYRLSDEQISTLDSYEGYPFAYQKFFWTGNANIMFGYWSRVERYKARKGAVPSLQYINLLLDGALENGFKTTYNALVDYKCSKLKLKGGSKHKKL